MAVRALSSEDVDVYRSIRLEALQSDPGAFGSTYEHELAYDEDTWVRRMSGFGGNPGQVFVAENHGGPVGMVGIAAGDDAAVLWGMWVREAARGSGIGRELLHATIDWAGTAGASSIVLQVAKGNDGAQQLYKRFGFEVIGQAPMRPDDPCSLATMMQLELR